MAFELVVAAEKKTFHQHIFSSVFKVSMFY